MVPKNNKPTKEAKIGIILFSVTVLSFMFLTPMFGDRQRIGIGNSDFQKTSSRNVLVKNNSNLEARISAGEEILVSANSNSDKELAAESFARNTFTEASKLFDKSLETTSNDPEALIYLNNSIAATDPDPVKIAVSVPIGGSLDVAQEILRGVAQAQNEINNNGKGGIERNGNKYPIQVIIANDNNDPEIASQIAAEFAADPEILAVIGHNSSGASLAAAPIYEEGNLVMVSPTSTASELTGNGNYIFRTTPSDEILAQTLARYVVGKGGRSNIAICADFTSPASTSFAGSFSASIFQLGGKIVDTKCDFASDDFNPDDISSEAIARGAESLLLLPSVNKINQALEVAKANDNKLNLFGNDSMYAYETLKVGRAEVNGMILPVSWHSESTADSSFNAEANKLWGMPGSWRTASAYDAFISVAKGLSKANNRQQLQTTLAGSNFSVPGVMGEVKFQNSGDRLVEATLVRVRPGKNSGTGFDFKPI